MHWGSAHCGGGQMRRLPGGGGGRAHEAGYWDRRDVAQGWLLLLLCPSVLCICICSHGAPTCALPLLSCPAPVPHLYRACTAGVPAAGVSGGHRHHLYCTCTAPVPQVYLPRESLGDTDITTAKSSEVNVVVPGATGEQGNPLPAAQLLSLESKGKQRKGKGEAQRILAWLGGLAWLCHQPTTAKVRQLVCRLQWPCCMKLPPPR